MKQKWSEISRMILDSNRITEEREKEFLRDLRYSLRFDYGMSATDARKLNDNKLIET